MSGVVKKRRGRKKELSLADQEFLETRSAIEQEEMLDRVEELLILRPYTIIQLSAELDISSREARELKEKVHERWTEASKRKLREKRSHRVRQLEHLFQKTVEDFRESQKMEVKAIAELQEIECSFCDGTGVRNDNFCVKCDGNGVLEKEEVDRQYVRVPGNPAFIQAATKILNEIIKLEGITPPTKQEVRSQSTINGSLLTSSFVSNSTFADAPTELLHQALAALHHLKTGTSPPPQLPVSTVEGVLVKEKADQETSSDTD